MGGLKEVKGVRAVRGAEEGRLEAGAEEKAEEEVEAEEGRKVGVGVDREEEGKPIHEIND